MHWKYSYFSIRQGAVGGRGTGTGTGIGARTRIGISLKGARGGSSGFLNPSPPPKSRSNLHPTQQDLYPCLPKMSHGKFETSPTTP